jgi:lysophospholipase
MLGFDRLFEKFFAKVEETQTMERSANIFKSDVVNSQLASKAVENMVQVDMNRVLIIYTGGTIGMQNNAEHGYMPQAGYLTQKLKDNPRFHQQGREEKTNLVMKSTQLELPHEMVITGIPCNAIELPALITPYSLYKKRTRYSILEYEPLLDSSNMTMLDWIKIATDIEVNYELYDAFLVLHGTDTMSFTASALSFMLENLGKSVIITGSQVPLAEIRTDAVDNLLGALTIAGHFVIPEVTLFFDNKLLRGNRTSKINALEFNAFESPNMDPLVKVGINIDVSWQDVWKPRKIARFRAHKKLNPSVASLRLFPGITYETVKAFLSPLIKGVVLETYGSGNAPTNRPDILGLLTEACDRGVVIVNCSQCKRATVTAIYETGIALLNCGIIPGNDMTPECALTKLSYLLGKYDDPSRVRSLIQRSLRGELTVIDLKQRFTYLPFNASQNIFTTSIMHVLGVSMTSLHPTIEATASLGDLEGESNEQHPIKTKMVPVAMCHVARDGDISTLGYLIQEFGDQIDTPNEDGVTALHAAVCAGKFEIVTMLLRHGSKVHLRNSFGRSPLFDAVHFGFEEIVDILRYISANIQAGRSSFLTKRRDGCRI